MRILIDIGHPAHAHQFRNAIRLLETLGHDVLVTARNKEVTLTLLDKYSIPYVEVGEYANNNVKKAINVLKIDAELYSVASKFQPDVMIGGVGNVYIAHVSWLLRRPSILFSDSERGKLQDLLSYPFTTTICTPSGYMRDLGKKQVRYNGYHELAYLHPNYFTPNPTVLAELGLTEGDPFIIVRFVSWGASHDIGQHGIRDKVGLVKALEQYGRVLITSEGVLPSELRPYQVRISPEKMHDLLYYATLFVSDSQTMTTEAAVLGTPAVRSNSFVGKNDMSNFIVLEENYSLIFNCASESVALDAAVKILNTPGVKGKWAKKREKLLEDKIDVTAFMVWFIKNYPQSFAEMKEHPEAQYPFVSVMSGVQ